MDVVNNPGDRRFVTSMVAHAMFQGEWPAVRGYLNSLAKAGLDRRAVYDEALRSISYSPAAQLVPPFEELFPTSQG